MAKEVFVPKLGQTVEEVTLVKWLAADGTKVEHGQEILEVETDKAVFTVEAAGKGYLHIGPYTAGMVVPVLTVVAVIGKQDETFDKVMGGGGEGERGRQGEAETSLESGSTSPDHLVSLSPHLRVPVSPRARKLAAERDVDLAGVAITPTGGGGARIAERDVLAYLAAAPVAERKLEPKATPVAQKLAAEAGIDLRSLTGTGPRGQIIKEDVASAVAKGRQGDTETRRRGEAAGPLVTSIPYPASSIQLPASDVTERIPLKGVRAIIADRMGTSVHTTARVTLVSEADATEFVAMRERLKAKVTEAWGFAPGYNDLLAKIVAQALRKFPTMNARLAPDAIELLAHVNLGLAVDTERGLLVPVIHDADIKTLREFGAEFRALVERARVGRSLPDDLAGGTFTITNLGMYDVDAFTPVINLPEAAILGVGRIQPKWVYHPTSPAAPALRQMLTLSLVFDHRLVDGAPAARFLQYIKSVIEEPYLLVAG